MSCDACKRAVNDGRHCRYCGEYRPHQRDLDERNGLRAERDALRAQLDTARAALEEICAEEYLKTPNGHPVPIAERALAEIARLAAPQPLMEKP